MSEAPPLPTQTSSDGREVWAWADAFSKHTQRMHRLAELRREISGTGTRCGDCNKWMKSRECPRERNVNGMSRGPSCDAPRCGQFVESPSATRFRADRETKLDALLNDQPTTSESNRKDGSSQQKAHPDVD